MNDGKMYLGMVLIIIAFISGFFAGRYPNRSGVSDALTIHQNSETAFTAANDAHNRIERNLTNAGDGITTSREHLERSLNGVGTIRNGLEDIERLAAENTSLLTGIECILLEAGARAQAP
jgi:hypothetical protein